MKRLLANIEVPALVVVPFLLAFCAYFQCDQSAFLTILVTTLTVGLFFLHFETSAPALRQIMPIVVLAALAAAGRILFAPIPDFKPVSAICIIAGAVFGRQSGFMVGALAALTSNFFFGQGPWTPWQMYSWGLIGYLAGIFASRHLLSRRFFLLGFGFLSGLLYGFILNSWYIVGFIHPITLPTALSAYLAGAPFDLIHSIATVLFLAILYEPWQKKLQRIRIKYTCIQTSTSPTTQSPTHQCRCNHETKETFIPAEKVDLP